MKYHLLLFIFTLFLTGIGHAATYTFIPQKKDALYSDTANWKDRQYPGTNLPIGNEVIFTANGAFQSCIIDTAVRIRSGCFVDSGAALIVEQGKSLTIGYYSGEVDGGLGSSQFYAHPKATVLIKGGLTLIRANPFFGGNVSISGSMSLQTQDTGNDMIGQSMSISGKLEVTGSLWFRVCMIQCNELLVSEKGIVTGMNGREFVTSELKVNKLTNYGKINLTENPLIVLNEGYNYGTMGGGAFKSEKLLINYGTLVFTSYFSSPNLFEVSGDFINSGLVSAYSEAQAPIELKGNIINNGQLEFGGRTNSNVPNIFIHGNLINNSSFSALHGGVQTTTGQVINSGSFNITGITLLTGGSFNNKGTCNLTIFSYTLSNSITCSFLNSGEITNFGKLEVGNKFVNAGKLTVISYD